MKQWACFECGEPCILSVPDDCSEKRPDLCPYIKSYEAVWKKHDEVYIDFRKKRKEPR